VDRYIGPSLLLPLSAKRRESAHCNKRFAAILAAFLFIGIRLYPLIVLNKQLVNESELVCPETVHEIPYMLPPDPQLQYLAREML